MNIIRENLFLGDITEANDKEMLINNGITTILTVTFDNINAYFPQELKRIQVGLEDSPYNDPEMIEIACDILERLLSKKGEKVLVHCAAGLSRSPFIIAKTLCKIENRDFNEVYNELKKIKSGIHLEAWL